MLQVFSLRLYHSSYIEDEVRRTVLSWIPPNVTMLYGRQRRKFFRPNLLRRASIKKCLDPISLSDTPNLCSLRLSLILENEGHASLPLKVFRIESRGEIPIRGRAVTPQVFVTS